MTFAQPAPSNDSDTIPRMPSWVISARSEAIEDVAFLSGAALSHLHLVLGTAEVPKTLLRDRLAMSAAEACMVFAGRPERARDLRDVVALLRPGDMPGPAGEIYVQWRRAVERLVSVNALHRVLPAFEARQIAGWLDTGKGGPVCRAATVFQAVLMDSPRAEVPALMLADASLAQALGWERMVPLLAAGLKRADLRKRDEDLRLACHHAVIASAFEAVRMAADLAWRVARLQTVTPKLRAKGAGAAVEMFLRQDAVAPSALPLADRAARRLCDRLVDLGAIRELTGRDTFRLYGV